MIVSIIFLVAGVKAQSLSEEAEKASAWEQKYYYSNPPPLSGTYRIYGGELGDTHEPKVGDAKVSFDFGGKAAADMFQKMGKDSKSAIYSEPGERVREKGDFACRRSPKGKYSCSIGVDLDTGKSIPATDC